MLKKVIALILIIMSFFLCTSCYKNVNDENATIQLWCYNDKNDFIYNDALASILSNAKFFCEKNNIPLEIISYDKNTISYDDYVLKRNVAAANGNMIILDDINYLQGIEKEHADYSKLENYENLFSVYKDKFCIPLGIPYEGLRINNEAIDYYDINMGETIITYNEYLEIKQQMKVNGARFKMNGGELSDTIHHFLIKNNLIFAEENNIIKDRTKFTKSLKETIVDICDDVILYKSAFLDLDEIKHQDITFDGEHTIYDENSKLTLLDGNSATAEYITRFGLLEAYESIDDIRSVIHPRYIGRFPCFYMYKKITNDKIYDLANHIVNDVTYRNISTWNSGVEERLATPALNTVKIREVFGVDENWECNNTYKLKAEQGQEKYIKLCNTINYIFEILFKDEKKSELIAKYYFNYNKYNTSYGYTSEIISFVTNLLYELSDERFNYKNEEVNKIIDKKINEFVTNFNIHYN